MDGGRSGARPARAEPGEEGQRRALVLRRMDEEWSSLEHDPAAAEGCRRWAAALPVLRGCTRPGEVLERVRSAPDEVLGGLLAAYGEGDALAGRTVLQALLPKVVLMAALDRAADVDDYLTALWCRIATYPLERRPTSVAANLALDTLKAVHRERRPTVDVVTPPDLLTVSADRRPHRVVGAAADPPGPSVGDVLARAREHRLLDPTTRELLHSVYADGLSGAHAARRHGLTPGAVRSRCSRAVRVLATHADLLAQA